MRPEQRRTARVKFSGKKGGEKKMAGKRQKGRRRRKINLTLRSGEKKKKKLFSSVTKVKPIRHRFE